jgi:peroxiredoxin
MASASTSDATEKRSSYFLWLGLFFTLLGPLSNGLYFLGFPAAAVVWITLLLPIAGLAILLIGVRQAFQQSNVRRKVGGSIAAALSVLVLAGTVGFFFLARHLPAPSARAPQVGQRVPDFTLPDSEGHQVSLSTLLAGPNPSALPKAVLLVFYRGYWWPFCVLELRGIEKRVAEFQAQGVVPVAVSVDAPTVSEDLRRKAGLTFEILSDPKTDVIRRYDLLHAGGGPDGQDISRPAEFLVDRSGVVRWENFTEDVRVRARADQMLAAARALR